MVATKTSDLICRDASAPPGNEIKSSIVRTPGVGVYLADAKHTNMENYGVQPDMLVEIKPEDALAGRDRQLEAAVEELMKQLNGKRNNTATEAQR